MLSAALSPSVLWVTRIAPWELSAGAGLNVGVVDMRGRADEPELVAQGGLRATWVGALATVSIDYALSRRYGLKLTSLGGYVLQKAEGRIAESQPVAMTGVFLQGGLSVTYSFE